MVQTSNMGGWAIAVVHGVGSPRRTETLLNVCSAIKRARRNIEFATSPKTHPDSHGGTVDVLEGKAQGAPIRAAEVYWGDISLVRNRFWPMVKALLINLFGLRYICERALADAPRLLRLLCAFPFIITRIVILPVHLLALAVALPVGVRLWLFDDAAFRASGGDAFTSYDGFFFALCFACLLAGGALGLFWIFFKRSIRSKPWDIALSFAFFAALSSLLSSQLFHASAQTSPVAQWLATCLQHHPHRPDVGPIGIVGDMVTQSISLSEGMCRLVAKSTPVTEPSVLGIGTYLALNEFVGDTAFYFIALDVLLLFVAFLCYAAVRRASLHPAVMAVTATMLFVVLTVIILEPVDIIVRIVQHPGGENIGAYWYELLLVPWLVVVVVAAASAFLQRANKIGSDCAAKTSYGKAKEYPRLIVSTRFQAAVIVSTIVMLIAFLAYSALPKQLFYNLLPFKIAAPFLLAAVFGIVMFSDRLRVGLNFTMDVINHFAEPRRGFPVRRAIGERFSGAMEVLLAEPSCQNLLIIAHSQGTVITLEALLADFYQQHLRGKVDRLTVMTFGSPYTHIYQHYFCLDYPTTVDEHVHSLANDVAVRWFNVFRRDDPIGTKLSIGLQSFPIAVQEEWGGHQRYWEDDVMLNKAIGEFLPGQSPA